MKKNLGMFDRILRVLFFIIMIVLSWTHVLSGIGSWIGIMVGSALLLTAIFGTCPIYYLLKIKSLKSNS